MRHALIRLREERRALIDGLKSLGNSPTQEARDLRCQLRREIHEVEEALEYLDEMQRFEPRRAA